MPGRTRLNRQIAVADELTPGDLGELVREGFRSVVDLRTATQARLLLSPEQERQRLVELGIEYVRLPVADDWVDLQVLDAFHDMVCRLPTPLLVHSRPSWRAGILTLMHMGVVNGWSAEETLQWAAQMGFICESPSLEDAVRTYLDQHREAEVYCTTG